MIKYPEMAVVHQAKVSGEATLNIYEINYPPIPMQTFKQNLNNMEEDVKKEQLSASSISFPP